MHTVQAHPHSGFRLLYVCTGNVLRSPFAELTTRRMLVDRLGPEATRFEVGSAGTVAAAGSAMDAGMQRELERRSPGVEPEARVTARQISVAILRQADLVLTMTAEHRGAAVGMEPGVLGRTFVLGELARLCALIDPADLPAVPTERAHALVDRARSLRPRARPPAARADDIDDPIGRSRRAHRTAADDITRAVQAIVGMIAEPGPPHVRGHR